MHRTGSMHSIRIHTQNSRTLKNCRATELITRLSLWHYSFSCSPLQSQYLSVKEVYHHTTLRQNAFTFAYRLITRLHLTQFVPGRRLNDVRHSLGLDRLFLSTSYVANKVVTLQMSEKRETPRHRDNMKHPPGCTAGSRSLESNSHSVSGTTMHQPFIA